MQNRKIGTSGLSASAIGLGCMAMSEFYGSFNEEENMSTMHRALELGISIFDTADLYGNGENERLLGRFLARSTIKPLIASKCGIVRTNEILSDGNFRRERCGHPNYIIQSCEKSLKRLGVNVIDLYYLHRVDPKIPVEDSVGALARLKENGKIRAIGISEPTVKELERASKVVLIDAVQSEYSLWTRMVENGILPLIRSLGSTLVCYSPLGRGLIRQGGQAPKLEQNDFRRTLPRFSESSFASNAPLFDLLEEVARDTSMSVPQVMLRWLLDQGDDILPIPGARKIMHLEQNIATVSLRLSPKWIARLSNAFVANAIVGDRYTEGKPIASA